jgi:hypothetical protein
MIFRLPISTAVERRDDQRAPCVSPGTTFDVGQCHQCEINVSIGVVNDDARRVPGLEIEFELLRLGGGRERKCELLKRSVSASLRTWSMSTACGAVRLGVRWVGRNSR